PFYALDYRKCRLLRIAAPHWGGLTRLRRLYILQPLWRSRKSRSARALAALLLWRGDHHRGHERAHLRRAHGGGGPMTDTNEQRRGLITREDARRLEREHERRTYDINREHAQRAHDRNSEFFYTADAAATKAAEVAIKAGLLMNGGSSVAMLAFIGT